MAVLGIGRVVFAPQIPLTEPVEITKQEALPVPTASISATPTVRSMTFAERNSKYGPCVELPILMYHHVEDEKVAKENKRTGLNVPPETFRKQMEYLKTKNYSIVTPTQLISFFDNGSSLPKKPLMITFDDGYVDNGDLAFPILRELELKATIFVPTGLMENNNYLTWAKIDEMKSSGLIYFGNHTWSHTNMGKNYETDKREIGTADNQLSEKGLNANKIFAYPYGAESAAATKVLNELDYKLAFSTHPGRVQCKADRLNLLRIRIGNAPLSAFGL